jgi:peptidoglycan hydrolase-like amidase
MGLFHPRVLVVRPASGKLLVHTSSNDFLLEGAQSVRLEWKGSSADFLLSKGDGPIPASSLTISSPESGAAEFSLEVPGKLRRGFSGTLSIQKGKKQLIAIVSMDLETAVASAVAAESPPDAPLEALKAQAVVARSYYAGSRARHQDFDFCDTTHCQFLRSPPPAGSPAYRAAAETRGLVLAWGEKDSVLPAMYSAYCGGSTRTLAQAGLKPSPDSYPYYAVPDAYCLRHPPAHLSYGPGHGIGMCQHGAAALARSGSDFRAILRHYYPNTALRSLP